MTPTGPVPSGPSPVTPTGANRLSGSYPRVTCVLLRLRDSPPPIRFRSVDLPPSRPPPRFQCGPVFPGRGLEVTCTYTPAGRVQSCTGHSRVGRGCVAGAGYGGEELSPGETGGWERVDRGSGHRVSSCVLSGPPLSPVGGVRLG